MNCPEEPVRFDCAGETLLGILSRPQHPTDLGIIVVVGGPQTRVGSHRQFVLLSRALAAAGYASLRFDIRGMGDSTGDQRGFEATGLDIAAAIDALQSACPTVSRIVLWGLCDAASASLLYWDASRDQRVAGFCLLNPWVRSDASLARTQVKHYYGQRLMQKEFWQKLLTGRLDVARAVAGLLGKLKMASTRVGDNADANLGFQDCMARAVRDFSGPILLLLSENDYTAKEFLEYATNAEAWHGLLEKPTCMRIDIKEADHTFSTATLRRVVESACVEWLGASSMQAARPYNSFCP